MAITNINNLVNSPTSKINTGTSSQTNSSVAASTADASGKSLPSQDAIVLTNQAQGLATLQQRIKDAPSSNQSRIDALKAAIEKGDYKVDSQRVAQKMVSMESELGQA